MKFCSYSKENLKKNTKVFIQDEKTPKFFLLVFGVNNECNGLQTHFLRTAMPNAYSNK